VNKDLKEQMWGTCLKNSKFWDMIGQLHQTVEGPEGLAELFFLSLTYLFHVH
jgi:hypothetical protein